MLTSQQTDFLKQKLNEHIEEANKTRVAGQPGQILLTCAIRFYPKTHSIEFRLPEINSLLPRDTGRCPLLIKRPSEDVLKHKVIRLTCRDLSLGDCETNDASSVASNEYRDSPQKLELNKR